MKNKGFTLIELLAVIVILAIIALIATPVILGIIDDARTATNERSAELVKAGVQNAYTSYLMKSNGTYPTAVWGNNGFMNDTYFTVDGATLNTATSGSEAVESGDVKCSVAVSGDTATITCTAKSGSGAVFPTDGTATDEDVKAGKKRVYTFTAKTTS